MRAIETVFFILILVLLTLLLLLASGFADGRGNGMKAESGRVVFFAYGANLDPMTLKGRAGGFLFASPAKLEGYALEFSTPEENGFGVANAVKRDGSAISGALYILSAEEFAALRNNSGSDAFYRTENARVAALGENISARMFVLSSDGMPAAPSRPYVSAMMRGIASFWGEEAASREIDSAYASVLALENR